MGKRATVWDDVFSPWNRISLWMYAVTFSDGITSEF